MRETASEWGLDHARHVFTPGDAYWRPPLPATNQAASRILKAGQVLGVSEDLVPSGDDVLAVHGTKDKPCRLDANAQQIRSAPDWRGHIKVAEVR